jgi:hypothetical protein
MGKKIGSGLGFFANFISKVTVKEVCLLQLLHDDINWLTVHGVIIK